MRQNAECTIDKNMFAMHIMCDGNTQRITQGPLSANGHSRRVRILGIGNLLTTTMHIIVRQYNFSGQMIKLELRS